MQVCFLASSQVMAIATSCVSTGQMVEFCFGWQGASVATSIDDLQQESKELGYERHRRRKKIISLGMLDWTAGVWSAVWP